MDDIEEQIRRIATEQFSRSGGPGGQNVNKVNTKVTLRIPVNDLGLTEEEHARLADRLAGRLNADGELVIHSADTRSQGTNRDIALQRAARLIEEALKTPRRRRPTKPSKAARERRLDAKRRRSLRKHQRKRPSRDDD